MTNIENKLKKPLWWLFALSCTGVGFYPFIYFIIDREFGLLSTKTASLLAEPSWNIAFYIHIVLGGIALLIGWMQFSTSLRNNYLLLHRRIGWLYVICVLFSGVTGLYIAFYATGGWISQTGFIGLALGWLSTTAIAFSRIRNGQIEAHQHYMILSYSFAFAAVTLRIWLPLLAMCLGNFTSAYRIVAWLCWIPNVLVALWIASRIGATKPTVKC